MERFVCPRCAAISRANGQGMDADACISAMTSLEQRLNTIHAASTRCIIHKAHSDTVANARRGSRTSISQN
jgi:hypothetical protein